MRADRELTLAYNGSASMGGAPTAFSPKDPFADLAGKGFDLGAPEAQEEIKADNDNDKGFDMASNVAVGMTMTMLEPVSGLFDFLSSSTTVSVAEAAAEERTAQAQMQEAQAIAQRSAAAQERPRFNALAPANNTSAKPGELKVASAFDMGGERPSDSDMALTRNMGANIIDLTNSPEAIAKQQRMHQPQPRYGTFG